MAIATRGYSAATGNSGTASVNLPGSVQIGDLAILNLCTVANNGYNLNSFAPAGWIPLYVDKTDSTASNNFLNQRVWYRVLTSGDTQGTTSVSVPMKTAQVWTLSIIALSGTGGATGVTAYARYNNDLTAATYPQTNLYAGSIPYLQNTTLAASASPVAAGNTQTITTHDQVLVRDQYNPTGQGTGKTLVTLGQGTGRDEVTNVLSSSSSGNNYISTTDDALLRLHPNGEPLQVQTIAVVNGPAYTSGQYQGNLMTGPTATTLQVDLPMQIGWQFRLAQGPTDARNTVTVMGVSGSSGNYTIEINPAMKSSNSDLVAGDTYLLPTGDSVTPNFPGGAVLVIGSGYLDSPDAAANAAAPAGTSFIGSQLSQDNTVLQVAFLDTNVAQAQPIAFYSSPITFGVSGNMVDRCMSLAILLRPTDGHGIPIADNGVNLSAYSGEPVFLDGSRSWNDSGEAPTITWSQSSSNPTQVVLSTIPDADPRHRMFTAPGIAGVYSFTVRATDPSLAVSNPNNSYTEDTVTVTINAAATPVTGDLLRRQGIWVTTQRTFK